jgi:hypothetical protein
MHHLQIGRLLFFTATYIWQATLMKQSKAEKLDSNGLELLEFSIPQRVLVHNPASPQSLSGVTCSIQPGYRSQLHAIKK